MGFLWCLFAPLTAQDQQLSDSLEIVYETGAFAPEEELGLLQALVRSESTAEKILKYSELLIVKAREQDSTEYLFEGYLQQGNGHRLKGNLTRALESFFDAA